mmetsp:Transcript_44952/g.103966  ORF Transcript_44952/g.103966 Transcript_44952/m.103966 type:complete len:201 (+) Transcript_44952:1003-1605(+)
MQVVGLLVKLFLCGFLLAHIRILIAEDIEVLDVCIDEILLVVRTLQELQEVLLQAIDAQPKVIQMCTMPSEEYPRLEEEVLMQVSPLPEQQVKHWTLNLLDYGRQVCERHFYGQLFRNSCILPIRLQSWHCSISSRSTICLIACLSFFIHLWFIALSFRSGGLCISCTLFCKLFVMLGSLPVKQHCHMLLHRIVYDIEGS